MKLTRELLDKLFEGHKPINNLRFYTPEERELIESVEAFQAEEFKLKDSKRKIYDDLSDIEAQEFKIRNKKERLFQKVDALAEAKLVKSGKMLKAPKNMDFYLDAIIDLAKEASLMDSMARKTAHQAIEKRIRKLRNRMIREILRRAL